MKMKWKNPIKWLCDFLFVSGMFDLANSPPIHWNCKTKEKPDYTQVYITVVSSTFRILVIIVCNQSFLCLDLQKLNQIKSSCIFYSIACLHLNTSVIYFSFEGCLEVFKRYWVAFLWNLGCRIISVQFLDLYTYINNLGVPPYTFIAE